MAHARFGMGEKPWLHAHFGMDKKPRLYAHFGMAKKPWLHAHFGMDKKPWLMLALEWVKSHGCMPTLEWVKSHGCMLSLEWIKSHDYCKKFSRIHVAIVWSWMECWVKGCMHWRVRSRVRPMSPVWALSYAGDSTGRAPCSGPTVNSFENQNKCVPIACLGASAVIIIISQPFEASTRLTHTASAATRSAYVTAAFSLNIHVQFHLSFPSDKYHCAASPSTQTIEKPSNFFVV